MKKFARRAPLGAPLIGGRYAPESVPTKHSRLGRVANGRVNVKKLLASIDYE